MNYMYVTPNKIYFRLDNALQFMVSRIIKEVFSLQKLMKEKKRVKTLKKYITVTRLCLFCRQKQWFFERKKKKARKNCIIDKK